MTPFGSLFAVGNALGLALLPRPWAVLPLLIGAGYMTLGQGVEVGPLTFTVIRLLILVGVVRVALRGERLAGGLIGLDWLVLLWGGWACLSALFHEPVAGALVFRLGLVYNAWGIYFLGRVFCSSIEEGAWSIRLLAAVLAVVAAAMVYEQLARYNVFSALGGVNAAPELREGRFRAQGPFAHPILAGTVGAVSLPLVIGLSRYRRPAAAVGALSSVTIVVASASSGPVLAMLCGLAGLLMWNVRERMRLFRWLAVAGYIALDLGMHAPAYYLPTRIDVVGGSTGWYRARLIESAIEHLGEWWLAGTDRTGHWMATGVASGQADIVNHYLQMGVWGGLPLLVLLVGVLWAAFSSIGRTLRVSGLSAKQQFLLWAVGCSLAAHGAAWMSVSYFDQTVVFFYLTLAVAGSAFATAAEETRSMGMSEPATVPVGSPTRRATRSDAPGRHSLPHDTDVGRSRRRRNSHL